MSPFQRFPFKPSAAPLKGAGPDYHLVHTSIPSITRLTNSLGAFPDSLSGS